jgi:hypothetical protein
MAKSIDLLLILFSSFLCLYIGNSSLHVNQATQTQNQLQTKRAQLRTIYTQEIGVREKSNKNDGVRVGEYLNYTGLNEGYAWCAAFVSWAFGQAGFNEPRTAWSPSLFPNKRIVKTPQQGDVFGIYFSSLKRIAHAGFVDEWGDKYVITVEGNTNDANSREGDGVYRKRRPISSIYQVSDWITPIK